MTEKNSKSLEVETSAGPLQSKLRQYTASCGTRRVLRARAFQADSKPSSGLFGAPPGGGAPAS